MLIRKYEEKDRTAVRKICINTAPSCVTKKKQAYTLAMYCDSYLDYDSEWCFVCENDMGETKGYILCSPDYASYEREYRKNYLKKLKKISFGIYLYKTLELRATRAYAKKHHAHLHIDIDLSMQRQGVGHKLMDTLIAKLRENGLNGVFLVCNSRNEKGCNFYKKYGFEVLDKMPGSVVFSMKL